MEQKKQLYPLKFVPVAARKLWGGVDLAKRLGKTYVENDEDDNEIPVAVDEILGESWELADMGFIESVVSEGWLAGNEFDEVIETYLERIVGENNYQWYGRQFPLLVKILDIKDKISVQVHPDDEIAEQRYDMLGRKALWYIMDVKPGAKIYLGLKQEISAQELYDRCLNGTITEVMNVIEPQKGDAFIMKPGMLYSAEGGLLVTEIVESSDLSFRVYDWNRNSEDRELFLEEAFDFIDLVPADLSTCWIKGPAWEHESFHDEDGKLINIEDKIVLNLATEPEFTVNRLKLTDPLHIYSDKFGSFIIYFCAEGSAAIQVQPQDPKDHIDIYNIKRGETILIPADMKDFFLVPTDSHTILLEAMVEKRDEKDEYIDPNTEPFLEGEDYGGLEDGDFDECDCHDDDCGCHDHGDGCDCGCHDDCDHDGRLS